jgi:hypothetical protein
VVGVFKVDGLQVSACKLIGCAVITVMVPPVPVIGIPLPDNDAPSGFAMEIVGLTAADETVTLTTATTPFGITFALIPVSRHI